MDQPADPATPFEEVYQSFLHDLAKEGVKASTLHRYRYNIVRFEKWLVANGHPAILASLDRLLLIAYRQYLEVLPQQPRGSIRRRRGGADEPPKGPLVPPEHQVPRLVAGRRGPSRGQPVPGRQRPPPTPKCTGLRPGAGWRSASAPAPCSSARSPVKPDAFSADGLPGTRGEIRRCPMAMPEICGDRIRGHARDTMRQSSGLNRQSGMSRRCSRRRAEVRPPKWIGRQAVSSGRAVVSQCQYVRRRDGGPMRT